MAVVRVISKDGRLLSPTTRCDHVRILLKEGKAKVVGKEPFTIQLLADEQNYFTFNQTKGRKVMSNAKKKNMVIVVAMIAVLAIGSIAAYFTATDSQTNTFVVGSVEIDQHEDAFDAINPADPTNPGTPNKYQDTDQDGIFDVMEITPNRALPKDPVVTNTGENDAFVYTIVAVPKKELKVVNSETGVEATRPTQLFQLNEYLDNTYAGIEVSGEDAVAALGKIQALKDNQNSADANAGVGSVDYRQIDGSVAAGAYQNWAGNSMPTSGTTMTNQANSWTGVDTFNDSKWYLLAVNPAMGTNTDTDVLAKYKEHYNVYLFAYATGNGTADANDNSIPASTAATLRTLPGTNSVDGNKATDADRTTEPVFRSVTVANYLNINDLAGGEDSIDYNAELEGYTMDILVKSFAIQEDNIKAEDSKDAATVWGILNANNAAYQAVADELDDYVSHIDNWNNDPVNANHGGNGDYNAHPIADDTPQP
jgi:predicted ribosomally synthesized peptide with SipW-like signal peptide